MSRPALTDAAREEIYLAALSAAAREHGHLPAWVSARLQGIIALATELPAAKFSTINFDQCKLIEELCACGVLGSIERELQKAGFKERTELGWYCRALETRAALEALRVEFVCSKRDREELEHFMNDWYDVARLLPATWPERPVASAFRQLRGRLCLDGLLPRALELADSEGLYLESVLGHIRDRRQSWTIEQDALLQRFFVLRLGLSSVHLGEPLRDIAQAYGSLEIAFQHLRTMIQPSAENNRSTLLGLASLVRFEEQQIFNVEIPQIWYTYNLHREWQSLLSWLIDESLPQFERACFESNGWLATHFSEAVSILEWARKERQR